VFRDARQIRALLDRDGVATDESTLQNRQQAKLWTSRDGMVHLRADFAPEDGAWVKNTLDLILGPRIGGPRFAGPTPPPAPAPVPADQLRTVPGTLRLIPWPTRTAPMTPPATPRTASPPIPAAPNKSAPAPC
jgi:hypothetical protein